MRPRDEPTVGVDPLLRRAIWKELHKVYEETKSTIVISTHYIQVNHNDQYFKVVQ
jgi:ABC-type multidrug transport system ATPase subunit